MKKLLLVTAIMSVGTFASGNSNDLMALPAFSLPAFAPIKIQPKQMRKSINIEKRKAKEERLRENAKYIGIKELFKDSDDENEG